MRIKQLKIEGFRSLKNVTWEPGDLNILIGPNGTGKSNLLRFLELMAVAAKGNLNKYIQSLGGIEEILWDGQAPGISFALNFEDGNVVLNHYFLELARLGHLNSYWIENELLTSYGKPDNSAGADDDPYIKRSANKIWIKEYILEEGREIDHELIDEKETLLSAMSTILMTFYDIPAFKVFLSSLVIYHDMQAHSQSLIRRPAVTRAEKRVDPDGQNLIPVLHTLYTGNRDFERSIDDGMRAAFGPDYEKIVFPPAADQLIQMRVRWKSLKREQSAANLSDGTLRFLFLLTVLASPDPPPVIAIDEPETGLHPAMLPIIAEYAVEAAMRAQVIITTHSPQMLDAFMDKNPTITVTKWQDGETVLRNLGGDDLAYWLKEYTLGALFKSGELERMG